MKIALIGSAPSSIRLAPYQDKDWMIWGCSPGVYGVAPRAEAWFELHRWEPGQPWFSPEYCLFLKSFKGPVWTSHKIADIPNSQVLPWKELVKKYGPYFFTSSLAWMMALAIEQKPQTIGLWGVDMSATEEYGFQRAGCQYLIMLARSMGIEVIVPPESDLMMPPPLYGICEVEPMHIKLTARYRELNQRHANAMNELQTKTQETYFLKGAMDDLIYQMNTWLNLPEQPEVVLNSTPELKLVNVAP
jgi:hypothetical protein